jgi:hypothetical protein
MLWAGSREDPAPEAAALAIGSAAALGAVDTVYAARGRISKVYLLDAAAELALVATWTAALMRKRRGSQGRRGLRQG